MNFLPIEINGIKVYAGFWKRFCALFIDRLIVLSTAFLIAEIPCPVRFGPIPSIILAVFVFVLVNIYEVYFHGRFGATPGKWVVGIRVTRPDGRQIGWTEAWTRSSVDIAFAFIVLVFEMWGMFQVDWAQFAPLGWSERPTKLREVLPSWFRALDVLQAVWVYSEVLVVLFNKRKRALHDFLAGTIVIKKQFAEK